MSRGWQALAKANPKTVNDPDQILPGQVLVFG